MYPRSSEGRTKVLQLKAHGTVVTCAYGREGREGFPGGSVGKEPACNAGDVGSIPGLGRSPGGGHGYPLWYSCLGNSMDRGAWWAI